MFYRDLVDDTFVLGKNITLVVPCVSDDYSDLSYSPSQL